MGNPAADRSVKNYLAHVCEEQLKVHITPRQAEPVLLSDLEVLSSYWQSKLMSRGRILCNYTYWQEIKQYLKHSFSRGIEPRIY